MGRPTDWEPLAASDPVPGDPAQISVDAAHLSSVAQLIQGEVEQLRKIAAGQSDERGLHIEKLKSAASDVAWQLDRVVARYQKTGSALTSWAPDLDYAQTQSLKALAAAQDAATRQQANQPIPRPSDYQPTPQDQQQDQARSIALNQANADLEAARRMLASATSYRDQKASETRSKIESAINDGVKDPSFWDQLGGFFSSIGDWISKNWVWILKDICTALEIVATILAIIALIATGVGWLLLAAFILTAVALAGRTLLAATGNGSWLEVGMDAFALVTLGIGGGITGLGGIAGRAAATVEKAVAVGDELAMAERAASLSGKAASFFGKIAGFINDSRLIPDALAKPFAATSKLATDLSETGRSLASTVVKTVDETTAWQRIFNTGEEPARFALKMDKLVERFPQSSEIADLNGQLDKQLWELRGVVGTGMLGNITGLGMSGFPVFGPNGWHWQPYHCTPFDNAEEALTISVPQILQRLGSGFTQVTGG